MRRVLAARLFRAICARLFAFLICLGVCTGTAFSQPLEAPSLIETEVIGLSLKKANKSEFGFGVPEETEVEIKMHLQQKGFLVRVDCAKDSPVKFFDDRGKQLAEKSTDLWFPRITNNRRACVFKIKSRKLPSGASNRIRLQGRLALLYGKETVTQSVTIQFKKGFEFAVGNTKIKIDRVGKPEKGGLSIFAVPETAAPNEDVKTPDKGPVTPQPSDPSSSPTLPQSVPVPAQGAGAKPKTTDTPQHDFIPSMVPSTVSSSSTAPFSVSFHTTGARGFAAIYKIQFFDAEGKLVNSQWRSSRGGSLDYTTTYELEKRLDAGTIKVTYVTDLKEAVVPFDLSVGIGLN